MELVRHRIDGLENSMSGLHVINKVRHRIDGLETVCQARR